MLALLLIAAVSQGSSGFDFDVRSGLKVRIAGIPVVSGETIQYYEDGWKKGYFSTNNGGCAVRQVDANTSEMRFTGYGGQATGLVSYKKDGDHLHVHYDFHWSGDKPAKIELTNGLISAEVMQSGALTVDGKPTRSLMPTKYLPIPGLGERQYTAAGSDYVFDAPLAKVSIHTSAPTILFDARGYAQDYAEGKSVLWLGDLGLDVAKDKPATFDVDWQIQAKPVPEAKTATIAFNAQASAAVIEPDDRPPLIVPKPTTNQLKFDKPLVMSGTYDFPAGHVRFWDTDFLARLKRRYDLPKPIKGTSTIHVDGGVSKLGFRPGGYQITITTDSISVLGEEDEGLHNGLRRLAELAFPHGGQLALPTGYLSGNPQIRWRGVHLFVGPESREFQRKLWDRVLLPMGFNQVVLQCERTQWDCLPNLHGLQGYMTKADLAALFADYRASGIDPIPLIQSFGHMAWLFEGKQNLDIAVNPEIPYTIDPRKPKAKELLSSLWDEACGLLKPLTVHFGCDEVDMLGFPVDLGAFTSFLWQQQMPLLKQIADKHSAQMMLWGDMALAPGEAIDATDGVDKAEAAKRRAYIPKGTLIADWHYKPEPKIEAFLPSLQLWKAEGFKPIACPWYRPDDVRSFDLAADIEKSGTLQTTWCGYFSNEQSMIENFDQFSAMVLAGDFSWSTRYDALGKLGYDPAEVFRKMYFRTPRPVINVAGMQAFQGDFTADLVDGDMHFKLGLPVLLRSLLSAPGAPAKAEVALAAKGRHVAVVLDALDTCENGELIGQIAVKLSDGRVLPVQPIKYGQQVRAGNDSASMALADRVSGYSIVEIELPTLSSVSGIQIESMSSRGGLRLHGLIIW
jgi:hypothetical protein